jgi:hypothetical protein
MLEAYYFMQKFRIGQLLLALSLVLLIVACGGQGKDELKPTLNLTGETTRTVNANSVVIEGALSDNIKVASFSYSLNSDKPKDVLQFLKDKTFKFTVDGLRGGDNKIMLIATDATGNRVDLEVNVTAGMTPDVTGVWGNQKNPYTYCGDSFDINVVFDFKQEADKLTASLKLGFPGNITTFAFEGRVSKAGLIEGVASDDKGSKVVVNIQLENDTLKGSLTFKDAYSCTGEGFEDFVLPVVLQKGVDLPPPPSDDTLEPNDTREQASPVSANSSHDLIFTYANSDWFTFTLDKTQKVTARVTNASAPVGGYLSVSLFDAKGNWMSGGSTTADTTFWVLSPGTYYLQLQMNLSDTPAFDYKLQLSTEDLTQDAYEPNDDATMATPVTLPFNQTLYLHSQDKDWFRIDLATAKLLDIQNPDDVAIIIYDESLQIVSQFYTGTGKYSHEVGLEAGRYYIQLSASLVIDQIKSYRLQLSLKDLPDQAFEPNNSQSTASTLTNNLNGTMILTETDEDWFKFTLTETRTVKINASKEDYYYYDLRFSVGSGTGQWLYDYYFNNQADLTLEAGTYFIRVYWSQNLHYSRMTNYTLNFETSVLPDKQLEPNDSFNSATPIRLPYQQSLFMFKNDEDWFKFNITSQQLLLFRAISKNTQCSFYSNTELYTSDGTLIHSYSSYYSEERLNAAIVEQGTYYLKIKDTYVSSCGRPYDLTVYTETIPDTNLEPNNTKEQAALIDFGFNREIVVTPSDEDWFKFTLTQPTQIKLSLKNFTQNEATFNLFRENDSGISLSFETTADGFSVASPILGTGTYYLKATSYYWFSTTSKYQVKFDKK